MSTNEEIGFNGSQLNTFVSVARQAGWTASIYEETGAVFAELDHDAPEYVQVNIEATPGKSGFLARRSVGTEGGIRLEDATNTQDGVIRWFVNAAVHNAYDRGMTSGMNGSI